jgi:WD40 repeat protein
MAAFADDRRISLWGDGSSPGLVDSPHTDDPDLDHAVFSPDRVHVLLFGARAEIRAADGPTVPGTIVSPPEGSGDTGYYHGRFDGDGSRVLLGATDIPDYVADAATGTAIWSVPDNVGRARDISPDGTTVVADRDGTSVSLWDIDTNQQVAAVKVADLGVDGLIQTTVAFLRTAGLLTRSPTSAHGG